MAVEASRVKARIKVLFPKANLTTQRLDEISDKLREKPEDGADDAAIDEVINEFNTNSFLTIEDIAKNDDRLRTLAKKAAGSEDEKGKGKTTPPKTDPKEKEDEDDPLAVILNELKTVKTELNEIKTAGTRSSITEKFKKDERLKGIPEWVFKGRIPESEDTYEEAVEDIVNDWKPFAEKNKLSDFSGKDVPPAGKSGGETKKISEKEADDLASRLLG